MECMYDSHENEGNEEKSLRKEERNERKGRKTIAKVLDTQWIGQEDQWKTKGTVKERRKTRRPTLKRQWTENNNVDEDRRKQKGYVRKLREAKKTKNTRERYVENCWDLSSSNFYRLLLRTEFTTLFNHRYQSYNWWYFCHSDRRQPSITNQLHYSSNTPAVPLSAPSLINKQYASFYAFIAPRTPNPEPALNPPVLIIFSYYRITPLRPTVRPSDRPAIHTAFRPSSPPDILNT